MKNGQVTIKDLARILKVSPATVSRALKDHPDISKDTKKAVVALAKELNYQPNAVALSLRSSKTFTIGVMVPEIVHYFFASVISGIESVAHNAGYHVMVCQSNEQHEREVFNVNAFLANRVDGLIVSVSKDKGDHSHFQRVVDRGVPLVFFDRISEQVDTHAVAVEDSAGAYEAVEYLIKSGCRRIAHLAGPETLKISRERREGYEKALANYNLPYDEDLVLIADSRESGYSATQKLLERNQRPDAIFTVNDNAAVGAIQACKHAQINIPESISIIGFSDDQKVTCLLEPTLSSVWQPAFEMGQEAAKLFLQQVQSAEPISIQHKILKTKLVLRDSTKTISATEPQVVAGQN